MANQDIYLRYKRSLIGPFWISLTMLATILGIGLLYSMIFNQEFASFLTFFACGLLAWNLLVPMMTEGCGAVTEAESHLRSIPIPVTVLAARSVYRCFLVFLHNFAVVILALLVFGHKFEPVAMLSLLGVAAYLAFGFFWTVAMAPLSTRYRDIPQVVSSIMQIAFFLTPIFWRPEFTSKRPMVTEANPFFHIIEVIRAPLLGTAPSSLSWLVTLGAIALFAVIAVIVNAHARKRIFVWL